MGGSFTQKGHGGDEALNSIQDAQAVEGMRLNTAEQAHVGLLADGCGRMAEFLAQAPWDERRVGLGATHLGIKQHLRSHNSICHRLTLMLEDLPTEAIPTAEGKKLQQMHRILQLSRMLDWPKECLQPETSTQGFDLVISEITEFETLRLGFLHTIKETILTVYDKLTNPNTTEPTNHPPQLVLLLDIKPALTWIQYKLPEELTHSILQLATLQATFGSLGDIAEIFLFEPRSESFITFYGSVQIPNFDGILAPHHGLIMIKNPSYPSTLIRSTPAPHYPTRRPAIGKLVTGRSRHEAMVVAIERNHWPKEWRYMIWREEIGTSPELLITILDRGTLNSQEIYTHISPVAVIFTDGDVAFFFNEFERPIKVTIIQMGKPGFYETVCMLQPLQAQLSPSMKPQEIESHLLFTADMWPSYTDNLSEEIQPGPTPKSIIKWGPKIDWDSTSDKGRGTAMDQGLSLERPIAREDKRHREMLQPGTTEIEKRRDMTNTVEGKRKFLPEEGSTVVIPKKRRFRGTPPQKILIIWRNVTIPCTFSALLTPATVITDIDNSERASSAALIKATLTPPDNLLATLHLDTPLSMQGINNGDILTLLDCYLCQDVCFLQWDIKIVKCKILHCKKASSNNDMSLLQYVKNTIN